LLSQVRAEDLIAYGFESEFVGDSGGRVLEEFLKRPLSDPETQ
jgi:hypothetical protein